MNKLCHKCNNPGKYIKLFNFYLCTDCKQLNEFTPISKTRLLQDYILKIEDLDGLQSYCGKTAYGDTTFYIKNDIMNCACNKYNTNIDNLYNIIDNIKNEKLLIKQEKTKQKLLKKQIKKESRKQKLIMALNAAGVQFRNDSKLCRLYIDDETDYSLNDVVNRMCQMKYLYEYCNYAECKKIVYNQEKKNMNKYFIKPELNDLAEILALNKYSNDKYPNIFPWQ